MEDRIVLKNEKEETITCNIIAMFSRFNKNYIIYEENDEYLASLYVLEKDEIRLIPITDEKDFDIVDDYLEKESHE